MAVGAKVLEKHPEVDPAEAVCVIESAYPRAFSPVVTYTVAVYRAEIPPEEDREEALKALRGLSKSKAASSDRLERLFTETIGLEENDPPPGK